MKFTKHRTISLKNHPDYSERWVQEIIANDPSVLGLGEIDLRDKERIQPRAGRLDLLLQDSEVSPKRRYEVEIQLGQTDETHIIRTLEYWDIERKRYPQYDHCAVIVAEEITSRFLNVISLFNGTIPLIAIQMSAIEVGDHISLIFTKVLDEMQRGLVDEDEEALAAPTDRAYWEQKSTPQTLKLVDTLIGVLQERDETLMPNYNKHYIGIAKDGQPFNFAAFRPRKQYVNVEIKLPKSEDVDELIYETGIDTLEYNARWQNYRLTMKKEDVNKHLEVLRNLFGRAYDRRA